MQFHGKQQKLKLLYYTCRVVLGLYWATHMPSETEWLQRFTTVLIQLKHSHRGTEQTLEVYN